MKRKHSPYYCWQQAPEKYGPSLSAIWIGYSWPSCSIYVQGKCCWWVCRWITRGWNSWSEGSIVYALHTRFNDVKGESTGPADNACTSPSKEKHGPWSMPIWRVLYNFVLIGERWTANWWRYFRRRGPEKSANRFILVCYQSEMLILLEKRYHTKGPYRGEIGAISALAQGGSSETSIDPLQPISTKNIESNLTRWGVSWNYVLLSNFD